MSRFTDDPLFGPMHREYHPVRYWIERLTGFDPLRIPFVRWYANRQLDRIFDRIENE